MNALSVTFDNLAEEWTVSQALPQVLDVLDRHGVKATFFCEGVNAEEYPDALREIADRGHEVAYHAWAHEQWGELSPDEEEENLGRGVDAFRGLGLELRGFRPPGGETSERTTELLRDAGFAYVSPEASRARPGVLPFRWPEVDAFHVLPVFEEQRRELLGDAEAGGVEAVREHLLGAVRRVADEGGFAAPVLHNAMIEMETEVVEELLAEARRRADAGDLRLARCDEVAGWIRG